MYMYTKFTLHVCSDNHTFFFGRTEFKTFINDH